MYARRLERATVFGSVRIADTHFAQYATADLHARTSTHEPLLGLHIVRTGSVVVNTSTTEAAVFTSGTAFVTQRATQVAARRGTFLTTLDVPASVAKGIPLPHSHAWEIQKSPLSVPAVEFIVSAGDTEDLDLNGFSAYYFERLLQEMFLGLLIDTNRPSPAARPPHPLTHALAVIVGRCTDRALTPAAVAEEVRLSLRQLQRLFHERNTTIGREIRRARVDQALTYLRDRQYDVLSTDQVAEFVGFSSGSSLARAMAAEGHPSPARAARSAELVHT